MERVHKIRPKRGLRIRFPGIKRFLNQEGEFIEWGSYWQRRLNDDDIEIVSTMAEEKKFIEEQAKQEDQKGDE